MDDFLILLQAKLDEAKSKGNVNADIEKIQSQLDQLKLQATIDSKSISNIITQMSKLGIQIGQDFGKSFNSGLSNTLNSNVLSQINKISDSSTSTIIQNEKKKQEAYKATSDAVVYHAGVISKLNKAETNGRFYGSNRGTGYFGTGHYFVDSNTKHELDNNSSYSKLPYTSVDISKYDNLFKATTDEIANKLHNFLENLTKFTQGSDRFNTEELFSQFKNVFTDTTMDIKSFGDKMEELKAYMSNSSLDDRRDSVSTQFMKSLGYGGVDTRGTKYADTRYGTVIYDLKEESVLQANITDELQKQGQMLEKINYEKGQVFDSSADTKIQAQIDAQEQLAEIKAEFYNNFNRTNLDSSETELNNAQKRLDEIRSIISDCQHEIDNADEAAKRFAKDMSDLGLDVSDAEMQDWKQRTSESYQKRIEELSLERTELEKRIPILEENYNKESQLANEAYKQAEQIVDQRRQESQQIVTTANAVVQGEEKKQQAIQETMKLRQGLDESISNNDKSINTDKLNADIKTLVNNLNNFSSKNDGFDSFKIEINGVEVSLDSLIRKLSTVDNTTDLSTIRSEANALKTAFAELAQVNEIQLSMTDKSDPKDNYELEIQKIISQFQKLGLSEDEVTQKTRILTEAQAELKQVIDSNSFDSVDAKNQAILDADEKRSVALNQVKNSYEQAKLAYDKYMQPASKEKITSTLIQVQNLLNNNTRVTKEVKAEWQSYVSRLSNGADIAEKEIKDIQLRLKETKGEMQGMGKLGVGFFDNLKSKIGSLSSYLSASAILGTMFQTIRTGISNIKRLDTALVDLKKTAQMSTRELYNFYLSANDTSKQMGVTTKEIIEQASAWSRLGFSTADAATKMAKYSSMFATISPGMDLDSATDGLVSVMKAFKIGLEDTDEVVDGIMSKINIIGNTQAVNNSDIVDFLRRSSSAMAEANNSLEDTIALGTAMTEITRDAAGAGQVLKTVSMRIRGRQTLPPYTVMYMLCA